MGYRGASDTIPKYRGAETVNQYSFIVTVILIRLSIRPDHQRCL